MAQDHRLATEILISAHACLSFYFASLDYTMHPEYMGNPLNLIMGIVTGVVDLGLVWSYCLDCKGMAHLEKRQEELADKFGITIQELERRLDDLVGRLGKAMRGIALFFLGSFIRQTTLLK